ncbi:sulfite exporter TauE/SafE family protein [Halostella sp. JP-L12]|uniref:sulfite exporter TauE/SafE family protein n=1 Tax=Halostella TaxID=1843185 RepID=UPI000EF7631D|nr:MULTISPECIES: sulfite exporter TauE/SafE family protein [Halostella]NHN48094.1 sulfite exporter TauE/SafE family protein [Halostella sp. JP-L12]
MLSVATPELILLLVVIALVSGVGCTTLGPGGIFVTIALYLLTPLSSAAVAGTAHVTFIAVGAVGAVGYARSGELTEGDGYVLAVILSATSILGAIAGAHLNAYVSRRLFGVILGIVSAVTGLVLLHRERNELDSVVAVDPHTLKGKTAFGSLGVALGVTAGLVGVGGPVFAVPALVLLGVPMLLALAIAQVQAIFISGFATVGYLTRDAVSVPYALITGVPLVFGAALGWLIAHRVDPERLKVGLGIVLIVVGAYLVL